jgi:hypothetical protein
MLLGCLKMLPVGSVVNRLILIGQDAFRESGLNCCHKIGSECVGFHQYIALEAKTTGVNLGNSF